MGLGSKIPILFRKFSGKIDIFEHLKSPQSAICCCLLTKCNFSHPIPNILSYDAAEHYADILFYYTCKLPQSTAAQHGQRAGIVTVN